MACNTSLFCFLILGKQTSWGKQGMYSYCFLYKYTYLWREHWNKPYKCLSISCQQWADIMILDFNPKKTHLFKLYWTWNSCSAAHIYTYNFSMYTSQQKRQYKAMYFHYITKLDTLEIKVNNCQIGLIEWFFFSNWNHLFNANRQFPFFFNSKVCFHKKK